MLGTEHAGVRAGHKLVCTSGGKVGVTQAAEDAEVVIGGWRAMEKLVGSSELARTARPAVEQVGDRGESVGPEFWEEGGMEEKTE